MDWLQTIVLSLVQGISEFLPISSSAHLILIPHLFSWPDQGLAFDVAAHVGTLLAVMVYFRVQLQRMTKSCLMMFSGSEADKEAMLTGRVLLATLPAILVGAFFHDRISESFREPLLIAATTIVFGFALLLANRERALAGDEYRIGLLVALGIGLAQILAFVPGTSRSGVTMIAGVLLGLRRDAAARFSFLLSIPLILGAGLYKLALLLQSDLSVDWLAILTGVLLSGASALVCIHLFLGFIEKIGFTLFVIYRLILGAVLLAIYL